MKNLFIDQDITQRKKETDVCKQWVLTLLANIQADKKTDIATVTSLLKPRNQPDSINIAV